LRRNVPEPLLPDMRPLTVAEMPLPAQMPLTEPPLVTRPVKPVPDIWPPEMVTTSEVVSGQVRPADAEAHRPSKLLTLAPPPPLLRFGDERSREPDRDPPPS